MAAAGTPHFCMWIPVVYPNAHVGLGCVLPPVFLDHCYMGLCIWDSHCVVLRIALCVVAFNGTEETMVDVITFMPTAENLPTVPHYALTPKVSDMTLRDHFAGLALIGMLTTANYTGAYINTTRAYEYADQMLKARG